MTGGKLSGGYVGKYLIGKVEQTHHIRYCASALSYLKRKLLLRHIVLLCKRFVCQSFLKRIKILSLYVFYQRDLRRLFIVSFKDNGGNLGNTRELGCSESSFAGYNLIPSLAVFSYEYRLEESVLYD